MALALRLLGRLFFIIMFVGAGIQKVQQPQDSAQYLSVSYNTFHKWIQTTQVFKQFSQVIPPAAQEYVNLAKEYTSPAFVQDHSSLIITCVGYTLLVSSALVLIGVSLAGWVLYLFTLSTIVIIHNPFANPQNFQSEFLSAIFNLAIAGIALFIASDIRPECAEKVADSKVEKTAKNTSRSTPQPQVAKATNKRSK